MGAPTDGEPSDSLAVRGRVHSVETFGTVDGPGTRLVVFVQGCPLRCAFCHNPDTWAFEGGSWMSVKEVLDAFNRNRAFYRHGGITVSGGEPLAQGEFVAALFAAAHADPRGRVHTCLDTSGGLFSAEDAERYSAVLDECDLVLLDIKHADAAAHQHWAGVEASHALALGDELARRGVPVVVRHVVVPGWTDDPEELAALGRIIGEWDNVVGLELLPYHTMGTVKYERMGMAYRLADVTAMEKGRLGELRRVALDARACRRLERGV